MGTKITPAQYQYICDSCGKETALAEEASVPDGWETWSRSKIGPTGTSSNLLLCDACGPSKASGVNVPVFVNLPIPPTPHTPPAPVPAR